MKKNNDNPKSSVDILHWQYKKLLGEIQQIELHLSGDCPCILATLDPPELCLGKHSLNINTLAAETAAMDKNNEKWLLQLADEADEKHNGILEFVCHRKDLPELKEWCRSWRKNHLEPTYYSCKLKLHDSEEAPLADATTDKIDSQLCPFGIKELVNELYQSDAGLNDSGTDLEKSHPELTKELLADLYVNQRLTTEEIALKYQVSSAGINSLLKRLDIPLRHSGAKATLLPDATKESLVDDYIKKELTISEIAEKYHVSKTVIERLIKEYSIPRRSPSEADFIAYKKKRHIPLNLLQTGENTTGWKGGRYLIQVATL